MTHRGNPLPPCPSTRPGQWRADRRPPRVQRCSGSSAPDPTQRRGSRQPGRPAFGVDQAIESLGNRSLGRRQPGEPLSTRCSLMRRMEHRVESSFGGLYDLANRKLAGQRSAPRGVFRQDMPDTSVKTSRTPDGPPAGAAYQFWTLPADTLRTCRRPGWLSPRSRSKDVALQR